jgi:hypothetical protein
MFKSLKYLVTMKIIQKQVSKKIIQLPLLEYWLRSLVSFLYFDVTGCVQIWLRSLEWQCLLEQWVQQELRPRQPGEEQDQEEEEEEPLNKIPRLRSVPLLRPHQLANPAF